MLFLELFYALFEKRFLLWLEEGCADTNSLFVGAHGVEWEYSNAVVHEFASELKVIHAWILNCEVEAIGKWCAHIVVIYEVETVGKKHVFHELGTPAILFDIIKEVILALACCFHKGCHGMLNTMGGAAGEGVHETVAEEITKLAYSEVLLHRLIDAMVELVANASHADALSCIGKGF